MSEDQDLRDAFVSLLSTQMRFNLATTKLLGKLMGNDQIEADDVDNLMQYLKLAIERSEQIIELMKVASDDS